MASSDRAQSRTAPFNAMRSALDDFGIEMKLAREALQAPSDQHLRGGLARLRSHLLHHGVREQRASVRGRRLVLRRAERGIAHDADALLLAPLDHLTLAEVGVDFDLVDGDRDLGDGGEVLELRAREKFDTPMLRTFPFSTNSSRHAHVCVYSILIVQMGLGEPSGSRSGCGCPSGFSSFFSKNAKGPARHAPRQGDSHPPTRQSVSACTRLGND